jgi:DNA polymerase-1
MLGIPYQEFIDVLKDASSPLYKTYKGYRQFAKALTFGILYGSSPSGIARNIGCTLAKATELIDLYFKTYPRIKTYVEDTHNMAKLNHYVLNEFGQIKHEYGTIKSLFGNTAVYNAALRNAQNVRVQSTASMLGLFCFIALNEEIKRKRGKTLCTVYDSIEIESPIVRGAEIIETAFYYMDDYPVEQLDWLDLPIGVEAEVGYNWGKMVPIHRGITQGELENILTELKEENNDRLH